MKIFAIVLALLLVSCAPVDPWDNDEGFAKRLLDAASSNGTSSAIDVVEVYMLKDEGMRLVLPIWRLRYHHHRDQVCESRDKKEITEFFRSFGKRANDATRLCPSDPASYDRVFHVVAYDSKLMRIAYFRYFPCVVPDMQSVAEGKAELFCRRLSEESASGLILTKSPSYLKIEMK